MEVVAAALAQTNLDLKTLLFRELADLQAQGVLSTPDYQHRYTLLTINESSILDSSL